jgi:sugar phosphate isomerase/epimerase
MKLAISNIAWNPAEDEAVSGLMGQYGFTGVEIAPTKIWPDPLNASSAEITAYASFWRSRGIRITSMQALLFGRPDLTIFETAGKRQETLEYLKGIARIGGQLGAEVLVFGSPRNRSIGALDKEVAEDIAAQFFRQVGQVAEGNGLIFCIEPNPEAYGCDFVRTSAEGRALVAKVGHPGFGLHLDAAAMSMSHENIAVELEKSVSELCYFHISEPDLQPIGSGGVDHQLFASTLRGLAYQGWLSVEMRAPGSTGNVGCIAEALKVVREHYS